MTCSGPPEADVEVKICSLIINRQLMEDRLQWELQPRMDLAIALRSRLLLYTHVGSGFLIHFKQLIIG